MMSHLCPTLRRSSLSDLCVIASVAAFSVVASLPINAQDAPAKAPPELRKALGESFLLAEDATAQFKSFVISRIPPVELGANAADWQTTAEGLRRRVLENVVFRGVPKDWRTGQPKIVWDDTIKTKNGYTIRKLRYEALPGLWIPALLYQPDALTGNVPVVLNVNGHESTGKSTEYKQRRCAHLARQGVIALNLEWIGMGQLATNDYRHNHLGKLDLCGRSGLSVFYLVLSRGLDVLLQHEHADKKRVAVTGLSGGGWQTIVISSLDRRVTLSVPVAGHSALGQRVENANSIGDLEQCPSDLVLHADYAHLNAMMAPRPLLLIYNTKDNCCFVASTVKDNTYTPIIPFYQQAGVADRLGYYENSDPGTHNYGLDNRQQMYAFVKTHFFAKGSFATKEEANKDDIFTAEQLHVPLPENNATFHTLAREAAKDLPRATGGDRNVLRKRLSEVLRYPRYTTSGARFTGPQPVSDVQVRRLHLRVGDEWKLSAIVVEDDVVKDHRIVLADGGFLSNVDHIYALAKAGSRVLCVDPCLIGTSAPAIALGQSGMLMGTVGERPLGVQAAQIAGIAKYFARVFVAQRVSIEAKGPRTSLIALCAAALQDGRTIDAVRTTDAPDSLKEFTKPSALYDRAPEAFCFGLLEVVDMPELRELAANAR